MNWPDGYHRYVFDTVGSTFSEAARIAAETPGPAWVLAAVQTEGRGRRGRSWASPRGNFAATLILRTEEAPEQRALRSFVAALALRQAFMEAGALDHQIGLKWPNDVLLTGGKIAGILLESGTVPDTLFIGMGVNLIAAPPPEPEAVPPVALKDVAGVAPSPEDFLTMLARAYDRYEQVWQAGGFPLIRTEWLQHATRLGDVITARTMRESLTGTFRDVDDAGQLVLDTAKGPVRIPAADIFF